MSLEHSFCMLFICAYVGLTLKKSFSYTSLVK